MAKEKISINAQLKKANAILNNLRPIVTELDRKEAQRVTGKSMQTIKNYLLGDGTNIDTALELIKFFQGRIAERENELQKAAMAA